MDVRYQDAALIFSQCVAYYVIEAFSQFVVQALVFMLLTAVFTLLIAQHGPEHAHQ